MLSLLEGRFQNIINGSIASLYILPLASKYIIGLEKVGTSFVFFIPLLYFVGAIILEVSEYLFHLILRIIFYIGKNETIGKLIDHCENLHSNERIILIKRPDIYSYVVQIRQTPLMIRGTIVNLSLLILFMFCFFRSSFIGDSFLRIIGALVLMLVLFILNVYGASKKALDIEDKLVEEIKKSGGRDQVQDAGGVE